MIAKLIGFMTGSWGVPLAIFSALVVAWQVDRAGQRSVGAERAKTAISEATNARIQTGDRAAARSRAGGLLGGAKIDPTTRP